MKIFFLLLLMAYCCLKNLFCKIQTSEVTVNFPFPVLHSSFRLSHKEQALIILVLLISSVSKVCYSFCFVLFLKIQAQIITMQVMRMLELSYSA